MTARFVGPLERLLYLRSLPSFDHLPPEEVAVLAHQAQERFFARGKHLARAGEPAGAVHFLVKGRASVTRAGRPFRTIEPPGSVGFLPVLAADPEGIDAVAAVDTLTLSLSAEDILDALEDNFGLLEAVLRRLALQTAELQRHLEIEGLLERSEPAEAPYPAQRLDLVERLILMSAGGPYRAASMNPLAELARSSEEVRYDAGEVIWREGEPADFGVHLAYGIAACTSDDGKRRFRMGPGSTIGYLDMLGLAHRRYEAVAETRIVGLRDGTDTLIDILEDNPDLGRAFVAFQAGALISLFELRADAGGVAEDERTAL